MTLRGWRLWAILAGTAALLAVAGWVLFSDDATTPVAVESGVTTVARDDAVSTLPATTTTSSTTSTTTTTTSLPPPTQPAPPPPPPPPPQPFSVAVTGDSMSRGILTPIQAALQNERTHVDHQEAGGFLKGREAFDQRLAINPPDVFVILLATWENAALQSGEVLNPNDPAWPEIYRRDYLEPWVAQAKAAGSEVIWVGMPLTRHAPTSAQNQELNAVWRDVAAAEPNVTWVDGPSILAGPDGGYLEIDTSVDPPQRLFKLDGLHLCQEASLRLTNAVLDILDRQYGVQANPGWQDTDWRSDPEAYNPGACPAPG